MGGSPGGESIGREADGADDCRRAVREQEKAGARVIKIMASSGCRASPMRITLSRNTPTPNWRPSPRKRQSFGIPTCAHAFGTEAVAAVVRAGINSVEHGVHLDDDTVATMASRGIGYVPTMANMARIASPEMNQRAGVPERAERFEREVVAPQREPVRRAVAAGVRIGVGTDSTGTYREELAALAAAGMTEEQVIRSATVDGATICRLEAGVVAEGKYALFALYDEDPRFDLAGLATPSAVFSGSTLLTREDIERVMFS